MSQLVRTFNKARPSLLARASRQAGPTRRSNVTSIAALSSPFLSVFPSVVPPTDRRLSLSSRTLRSHKYQGTPTVLALHDPGVADGVNARACLDAVVDAVHWSLHALPTVPAEIQVAVPVGQFAPAVRGWLAYALWSLAAAASTSAVSILEYDLTAIGLHLRPLPRPTDVDTARPEWLAALTRRSVRQLPAVAADIQRALGQTVAGGVPSFRWYRNITGPVWSGRVGGWQVCTVTDSGKVAWHSGPLPNMSPNCLAAEIVEFARQRANPQDRIGQTKLEHLLESGVLGGKVLVQVERPTGPVRLMPVVQPHEIPFQFPAYFGPGDSARFVDALMHDGQVPWVVELKVATGGQGEYYRHAITQAVLYRTFVRQATSLHAWFCALRPALDPTACEAAIAVPALRGPDAVLLRESLTRTAGAFGVAVVELDALDRVLARALE